MHLSFIQLAQNTTAYRHAYDRVLYVQVYITAHFFFALTLGFGFLLSTRIGELHMSTRDVVEATPPARSPCYSHAGSKRRAPELYSGSLISRSDYFSASLRVAHTWLFVKYVNHDRFPTIQHASEWRLSGTTGFRHRVRQCFRFQLFFFFKDTPTNEATHTQMRRFGTNTQAWFALGACLTTIHSRSLTQAR